MREEKPNQKEKLHIPYDQIRAYLPRDTSYQQTCDYIRHALEYYQKYHQSAYKMSNFDDIILKTEEIP